MYFIWYIIIGIIAGFVAGKLMRGGGFGLFINLLVGIVGGVLGGWVFSLFGIAATGIIGSLVTSMLDKVYYSYVMEKAVEDVKKHGRFVTGWVEGTLREQFKEIR